MKQFIRKMTAAVLALSMALGVSVTASAATTSDKVYSLKVQDKKVQFLLDKKVTASYDINNDNIELITDRDGDFLVCFYDDRGTHKGVSLGSQKSLSVDGVVRYLRIDDSLNKNIKLTVASGALVKNLNVRSPIAITVDGRVSYLETDCATSVTVSSSGTLSSADLESRKARIHAAKGATVKNVQANVRANITGDVDDDDIDNLDDDYYYDEDDGFDYSYIDREDRLRVRLEIDEVYARKGDRLVDLLDDLDDAVYAYVDDDESSLDGHSVSGSTRWRGADIREELETSGRYSFTFTPDSSKYRSARGTIRVIVR